MFESDRMYAFPPLAALTAPGGKFSVPTSRSIRLKGVRHVDHA
ncbi:MAG TPA: hypothetical protein VG672_07160 [Bryobacteraceae bacterium]|jgi:hypothetical protein|nr:hypothetical protein [Bryobacteraceae bacterium]